MEELFFLDSGEFLSSLTREMIVKVYGDLDIATIGKEEKLSDIVVDFFGDYIIRVKCGPYDVFISSSAASLSFVRNDKIYSEEDMIGISGYSDEYLKNIESLGRKYAPKNNMFDSKTITLLPACVLILDQHGSVIQNTSWFDLLLETPSKYSLEKMKNSVGRYFESKKTFLLTSGGIDTAVLINLLKSIKDIKYASYYFERTGGNNTPEDARRLLHVMMGEKKYQHEVYQLDSLYANENKIYEQDVDLNLMKRLDLIDTSSCVACGQNSDSIIAPGFVKSDSLLSTFSNWGLSGGLKAMTVNTMLVFFRWDLSRRMLKGIFFILNLFLKPFSDKKIDYSVRGFYLGLFDTIPFVYSKRHLNNDLHASYDNVCKLFLKKIKDDNSSLVLLRLYTYAVYAMQNQRGVKASGYKYLLPFHSAYFIGFCLNRDFHLSEIWNPKKPMRDFLCNEGLPNDFLFYRKDLDRR